MYRRIVFLYLHPFCGGVFCIAITQDARFGLSHEASRLKIDGSIISHIFLCLLFFFAYFFFLLSCLLCFLLTLLPASFASCLLCFLLPLLLSFVSYAASALCCLPCGYGFPLRFLNHISNFGSSINLEGHKLHSCLRNGHGACRHRRQ
jgi:hypothetical protein